MRVEVYEISESDGGGWSWMERDDEGHCESADLVLPEREQAVKVALDFYPPELVFVEGSAW